MVLYWLFFRTNCNNGKYVFGKGGLCVVGIMRRRGKMEGFTLASSAVHGRVHLPGDGLDCDAGYCLLRWVFFGKGGESGSLVSEGGQNGVFFARLLDVVSL